MVATIGTMPCLKRIDMSYNDTSAIARMRVRDAWQTYFRYLEVGIEEEDEDEEEEEEDEEEEEEEEEEEDV